MALKKKTADLEWAHMTNLERAAYCEKIAEDYHPGFCKDQVLSQAKRLREMADMESNTSDKK